MSDADLVRKHPCV